MATSALQNVAFQKQEKTQTKTGQVWLKIITKKDLPTDENEVRQDFPKQVKISNWNKHKYLKSGVFSLKNKTIFIYTHKIWDLFSEYVEYSQIK